jgi:hypothetical protein
MAIIDSAELVITQVTGGTTNQNTNTNTNTDSSTNHNFTVSTSTNTENSNSVSHSQSFSNNSNVNLSTDYAFTTSNSTSNSTSVSTNHSTNVDTSNSISNNTSTSTSTSNNVNFSQSDIEVATINAAANNYSADQVLAGVNVHEAAETYRLNLKLAFAKDRFEEVFPLVGGVASSGSSSSSGGSIGFHALANPGPVMSGPVMSGRDFTVGGGMEMGYYSRTPVRDFGDIRMGSGDVKTGGIGFATGASVADAVAATQLPFISTSGVLTPAQIQQQINASNAKNDTRTQSEIRRLVSDLSGRGFSSNSPIISALRVGLIGQNLRANIEGTTQIQIENAKLNADAMFAGQKAVSDQFNAQEQVLVSIAVNDTTRVVGVLKAVTEMVGSAL